MKQFLKFTLASFTAMILAIIVAFFLFIGAIAGIISSSTGGANKPDKVANNSVLHIMLENKVTDRASMNPFDNFDFSTFKPNPQLSLTAIVAAIKKAKNDDRIKGIYLDLSTINAGMASVEEIRNALADFKTSKKWIVSYAEIYTQKSYYLASVSNKVYVNPAGIMELRGLASQLMFFKNALNKLDIDVQIIRHGKFKSAVEPFMLDKMSPSNRKQMERLLNSAWGSMLNKVAESRNISVDKINELANGIKVQDAKDAVKYGFVDKTMYKDEMLAELHNKLALKDGEEIQYQSLTKYANVQLNKTTSNNKIAVIYASGDIVSGESKKGKLGSETISKAIRDARLDDDIKAIVLRVNSPGGSAMASDVMWREIVLAKKAKPVVVSMGDVAASGGYYISCAADKIVASEKTITGSIGVFGIVPNAKGFFNNKLGITFDTAKTNTHADMMTIFRPLTAEEKDIMQIGVERIYGQFIGKVAKGRGMTVAQVDSIGQGRVWTGIDAKKIGLVDEIGGLDKALDVAKDLAKLDNFDAIAYPVEKKTPFNEMMKALNQDMETKIMEHSLGVNYKYYEKLQSLSTQSGIMARMPFEIEMH